MNTTLKAFFLALVCICLFNAVLLYRLAGRVNQIESDYVSQEQLDTTLIEIFD